MKEILRAYKYAPKERIASYCLPIQVKGKLIGRLRPITAEIVHHDEEIRLLTEWREASSTWFTTQFPVTLEGTRSWLLHQVIQEEDRILFFVEDEELTPIGQIGLLHYDEVKKQCEFDNLLRGRKGRFGNIMIYALLALGEWSLKELDLQTGYINVLADNYRAVHMYQKLGAREVRRVPLMKVVEGHTIRWVPALDQDQCEAERYLATMSIQRKDFMNIINNFS